MDNRKNIKVIDEHSIDRSANIICSIDVDGTDYVVYSIKRDEENDNLFISKLIRNNDGTSNMINIDDTTEKSMLADIVKELVTYAINNDADKTTGEVTLSNGRKVKISSVLFNKEQNINVSKTYITTVKRAVTKVSENFYYMEYSKPEPVVESVFDTSSTEAVFPEVSTVQEPVAPQPEIVSPIVEPVLPEVPSVVPVIEPSTPVVPSFVNEPVSMPEPSVVPPVVEPILPEAPVSTDPIINSASVNNATATFATPSTQPEEFFTQPAPMPEATPVIPTPVPEKPVDNQLVFDGSKETNLNDALGEVSKDNILPVSDVASIKEFGQDDVSTPVVNTTPVNPVSNDTTGTSTTTSTSGFANNKFFMVIAVAFFLAACVFLGYEVFRYFKLVG